MKKRNAMAIVCVVAMGVFVLSGCGIKDYVEQKVTEGITETVTETILEGSGLEDVDIDGDSYTIVGEDGSVYSYGESEWPTSDLGKAIPEFKKGTITGVFETETTVSVNIDEVEWDDAIEYVDDLKSEFSTNPVDFSSEEDIMYQGTNEDGVILTVMVSGTTISVGVEKQ